MNTIQIRKTCRKCQHHTIKEVQENPEFPDWLSESAIKIKTDWCLLGDIECSQIKTCDPVAKEYKRCSTNVEQLVICPVSKKGMCDCCYHRKPHKRQFDSCFHLGCEGKGVSSECVTYVPNAQKASERKTGKRRTKKSGCQQNGEENEKSSLQKIPYVCIVEIKVTLPITQKSKSMGHRRIYDYPEQRLSAHLAIEGYILEDSNVPDVEEFLQRQKVRNVFDVLEAVIENELNPEKNSRIKQETPSIGEDTGKRTQKKL